MKGRLVGILRIGKADIKAILLRVHMVTGCACAMGFPEKIYILFFREKKYPVPPIYFNYTIMFLGKLVLAKVEDCLLG